MISILYVDKYKNQRLLCEQEFSLEGYGIITASNGNDACEIVETRQPDIIIMDVCMFSMSGVRAMCGTVSKYRDIPLIVYTAYENYKDVFMLWDADAYIVKSSD